MRRAYTWRQITEMGFEVTDYDFPTEPGIVNAALVMKRWGNNNLVCYFEGDDGEKIKLCAWWSQYENRSYRPRDSDIDFTEVELGTRFKLEYGISTKGGAIFISAEPIGDEEEGHGVEGEL